MPDTPPTSRVTRVFGFDPRNPYHCLVVQTVNVYLRTNSQRETARRMQCSRSTVRNRLNFFETEMNRHMGPFLPPGETAHIIDPL